MPTILCVDDDPGLLGMTREILSEAGYATVVAANAEAAMDALARGGIDLVLSDDRMPGTSGLELLAHVQEMDRNLPFVMMTGYASIDHAVTTIKAGAADYLTKPIRPRQLEIVISQALEFASLAREIARPRADGDAPQSQIIGESEALLRVLQTARSVSTSRATVLLLGESGTGKEMLARTIHQDSKRDGAFVSVNCAALPGHLIDSVLVGHEKGAFTGAARRVLGVFERAHKGTLLLDEVGEMRFDLQAKLVSVLQSQDFERLGGTQRIKVDVRVIATSASDVRKAVEQGRFREDLYYLVCGVPIVVPPLRERLEDIPLLARHFAKQTGDDLGRYGVDISPGAIDVLSSYDWPGNIRELKHSVERAVILSPGETLERSAFDTDRFGLAPVASRGSGAAGDVRLAETAHHLVAGDFTLAQVEDALLERTLRETGQNRATAAELLESSMERLVERMRGAPSDIFLSYARVDVDRVRPLVEILKANGWTLWWDDDIPKGEDFSDVIRSAIENSRTMVVVWSAASVSSDWVRGEAREGRHNGHAVIPVRLDSDARPPIDLQGLHEVDLSSWHGTAENPEIKALVKRLRSLLGGRS